MFINADSVAQVSISTPRQGNFGNFYHEVHLTYKPGHEGLPEHFEISENEHQSWVAGASKVLNNNAFIEESPPVA